VLVKGALQLLSKRFWKIYFAQVPEQLGFQLLTAITIAMYPRFTHKTRNSSEQVSDNSERKPSFITSYSTNVLSTIYYTKAAPNNLGTQGTFNGALCASVTCVGFTQNKNH